MALNSTMTNHSFASCRTHRIRLISKFSPSIQTQKLKKNEQTKQMRFKMFCEILICLYLSVSLKCQKLFTIYLSSITLIPAHTHTPYYISMLASSNKSYSYSTFVLFCGSNLYKQSNHQVVHYQRLHQVSHR